MKLVFFIFLFCSSSLFAQLRSPDDFLGYELGTKYTPHYKIVNYFNHAAAAMPQMMKLENYGQTNEGRDLLIAIITSPANFSRLEEIRKNNLRLTGLLNDRPGDVNAPAIVWLSYNVHGNEASSSEVSMKTLYELLNPNNAETKTWLANTVVIIDPCLNPDGRDRHVNWYNEMSGSTPNSNIDSREQNQPWPNGRTNHYNFDHNRDWAWQTQVETQQRLIKYNQWMPEVHCDFHEMGYNSNYYFAPGAEPLHETITSWQRDFQNIIGRNHARYFDAHGWMYFTKESYDLFYPSYGDTYPMYNGAIGMTYEQASSGAISVVRNDGDTLTLKDRIAHHFTTGMSTIETSSKNAARLLTEFKQFFVDASTKGVGEYGSYIITADDNDKLVVLKTLLEKNKISYGSYNKAGLRGYNYFTGKDEPVITEKYTIAISNLQPMSALIKGLFEPRSKLNDSITYDITAWSLPYAFGLKTYAVKENFAITAGNRNIVPVMISPSSYGYLVKYNSFSDAKLLAGLLQQGVRVRIAEAGFTYNNKNFTKGSLLILRSGNENMFSSLPVILSRYNATVDNVGSGFMDAGVDFGSEKIHFIKAPRVAMLTGEKIFYANWGEIWHLFDQQLQYPITLINVNDIGSVSWRNIDVLILPDGNYKFLSDKDGANDLKTWVRQGGKIIAMENAVAQMAAGDWGIKLKKNETDDDAKKEDSTNNPYSNLKKYANRERDDIINNIPGAIYKVELDNSHPLAFGYPGYYYSLKKNDNIYAFMKDGWNVGIIKKDTPVSGFVGSRVKEKLKDGTVIGVVGMGNGQIVFFAEDPIFRSFWENGKLLLSNAVFLVGQ